MSEAVEYQGWNEWAKKFKPQTNHFAGNEDYRMYETYGKEVEYVQSMHPNFIWTLVQGDFCDLIVAGYHYVNRLGYYITENPWSNEDDTCLVSVEKECECYDEDRWEETGDAGDPECAECEGYGYVTNYL